MKLTVALALFSFVSPAKAFQPLIGFWQVGSEVVATVDSSDLVPQLSNDLRSRSVTIGGWGISEYKAIVINSGTCADPGNASALLAAPVSSLAVPFTFTPNAGWVDAYYTVCVIGKNFVGVWQNANAPTPSYTLHLNTEIPVVQSLTLNNGTTPTSFARIPIAFAATHSTLNVTHFCLKVRLSAVAPTTPTSDDSCWYAVNNPSPGQTPSPSVSFSNFIFNLGFATGDYYVYAWAKAESGAISYLSSLGNGSDGVDKGLIHFDQSLPPTIVNVLSVNSDAPASPVTTSDLVIPSGSTVYIKWNVTDDQALPPNPITLSYTTDEANFTTIASNLTNAANGACTVDAMHTGCYVWTNGSPTSAYFKIRVSAIDSASLIASASAAPNNTAPFEVLAGNTDLGLNTSASSAIIFPKAMGSDTESNAGCFVVTDTGVVYLVDQRGRMTIDPADGLYRRLIPVTGVTTTGAVGTATLHILPRKLALDYSGGLLIYDYDRIVRLDLSTQIVSTFIGGGGTTADDTDALGYALVPTGDLDGALTLMPLPNGDVWFTSGTGVGRARNGSHIEVFTASDHHIHWKTPTGTGSREDAAYDPSSNFIRGYGFAFNPTNSQITKIRSTSIVPIPGSRYVYSISYDPTTFTTAAPHIPYLEPWSSDPTLTTSLGEMYALDRFQKHGLYKYNSTTNAWDLVVGTGYKGACDDGTDALSCDVDIYDAFVSAQGTIYIMDRNRIRTVDADGKMLTLFGQTLSFGDGGLATSARIGEVYWLDRSTDGKITYIDNREFKLREFMPGGSIQLLAGTGSDANPDTVNPASGQPISVNYYGARYPFIIDKNDNGILFRRGDVMSKLDRSTGKWVDIVGGGSTSFTAADGLSGAAVLFDGYGTGPNGFDGSRFFIQMNQWNGSQYVNGYMKTYTISDGTQAPLAGKPGPIASDASEFTNATAGDAGSNYRVTSNGNVYPRVEWDSSASQWLVHAVGSSQIKPISNAGVFGTTISLPRGFWAFTRVVKGSDTYFYYCATNARMYKYDVTTSTETALAWPSATLSCMGYSMAWDSVRNAIVFPISQNGLGGIAQIYDP
jgi:hypothetical protein